MSKDKDKAQPIGALVLIVLGACGWLFWEPVIGMICFILGIGSFLIELVKMTKE